MPQTSPLVDWLNNHLALVGWPAVIAYVWKISRGWTRVEDQAQAVMSNIEKIKDNHLAHLQDGMNDLNSTAQKMDENISGLRDDARTYFLASQHKK